jgi:hypothetical protein
MGAYRQRQRVSTTITAGPIGPGPSETCSETRNISCRDFGTYSRPPRRTRNTSALPLRVRSLGLGSIQRLTAAEE